MKIKIEFEEPQYLPSAIDGIEFIYLYSIERMNDENASIKKERKQVKISIAGGLAFAWGYTPMQEAGKYEDLKRKLFYIVIDFIKKKITDDTLTEFEKIKFSESNPPPYIIKDMLETLVINGFTEVISYDN